jgi:Protein of unknown function (DUF1501)
MLTLWGRPRRFCDGIQRRAFMRIGAGLGGLTLVDMLRGRAQPAPAAKRPKSIIFLLLGGGPSHIDMYDLKPDARPEVRGEFKPIHTNVPGFDICELFPLQAKIADRPAVARGVVFQQASHTLSEVYTGLPPVEPDQDFDATTMSPRPAFGSIVSRLRGSAPDAMPRYVDCGYMAERRKRWTLYAGAAHEPFVYSRGAADQQLRNLELRQDVGRQRLQDRKQLLQSFDTIRRNIDRHLDQGQMGPLQARALEMITSGKVREAFDLGKEPDKVRQRYGKGSFSSRPGNGPYYYDHEPVLLARRLVEAGVSVVTCDVGAIWDMHADIFPYCRLQLPLLDHLLHNLLTDLHERGLDKDVAVVMLGEFGRTPHIELTGRSHWPQNGFVLFAGGGLRTGQVIGESDAKGAHPKTRRLSCQNVLATCYHVLGIDPEQSLNDLTGRPVPLLDDRAPISELVT